MADMSKADIAPLMAMPARKKTPRKKIAVLGGRVLEMGLSAIFLFALWEGIVRFFAVPSYIFPAPSAVTVALWQGIVNGAYTKALIVTTNEIVVGLFLGSLVGILLGFAMVSIPRLDRLIYPYVVASQTVPKVAIAPLFIVWFGLGIEGPLPQTISSQRSPVRGRLWMLLVFLATYTRVMELLGWLHQRPAEAQSQRRTRAW